jgi:hypothetical protein
MKFSTSLLPLLAVFAGFIPLADAQQFREPIQLSAPNVSIPFDSTPLLGVNGPNTVMGVIIGDNHFLVWSNDEGNSFSPLKQTLAFTPGTSPLTLGPLGGDGVFTTLPFVGDIGNGIEAGVVYNEIDSDGVFQNSYTSMLPNIANSVGTLSSWTVDVPLLSPIRHFITVEKYANGEQHLFLHSTSDQGLSWASPIQIDQTSLGPIGWDPVHFSIVNGNEMHVGWTENGVRKMQNSADGGVTWAAIDEDIALGPLGGDGVFSVANGNDIAIFGIHQDAVTGLNGLYANHSTDGGKTFQNGSTLITSTPEDVVGFYIWLYNIPGNGDLDYAVMMARKSGTTSEVDFITVDGLENGSAMNVSSSLVMSIQGDIGNVSGIVDGGDVLFAGTACFLGATTWKPALVRSIDGGASFYNEAIAPLIGANDSTIGLAVAHNSEYGNTTLLSMVKNSQGTIEHQVTGARLASAQYFGGSNRSVQFTVEDFPSDEIGDLCLMRGSLHRGWTKVRGGRFIGLATDNRVYYHSRISPGDLSMIIGAGGKGATNWSVWPNAIPSGTTTYWVAASFDLSTLSLGSITDAFKVVAP